MTFIISFVTLLALIYQLYQQRIHNEKSVKPLVQIDLIDREGLLAVYVRNNGIGPYIIKKLEFIQSNVSHSSIEDCLSINPKTYRFIPVTESTTKILLPDAHFELFSIRRNANDTDKDIDNVKRQLAPLIVKVIGNDIYDNKIIVERNLDWFLKYRDI